MKILIFSFFILFTSFSLKASENCVNDIKKSLSILNHKPKKKKIYLGTVFKDYEYSKNIWNLFGFFNHFQGILYEPDLDQYVITGGDRSSLQAHLIFVKNINGKYIFTKKLDINSNPQNWHPGALVKFKGHYIVPIEEFWLDRKSEILVTNLKSKSIFRNIPIATGAVSTYSYKDQDYLIGFDMYGTNFFKIVSKKLLKLEMIHQSKDVFFNGSNSVIINQCDKKMFILSFGNSNPLAPIISDKDFIKLYSFDPTKYKATFLKKYDIDCKQMCHFRGAVNAHIVNKKLEIIATETNKSRGRSYLYLLKFVEKMAETARFELAEPEGSTP